MQWTFKIRVLLMSATKQQDYWDKHTIIEALKQSSKVGKRVCCCVCNRGISQHQVILCITTVCHSGTNVKGLWNAQSLFIDFMLSSWGMYFQSENLICGISQYDFLTSFLTRSVLTLNRNVNQTYFYLEMLGNNESKSRAITEFSNIFLCLIATY